MRQELVRGALGWIYPARFLVTFVFFLVSLLCHAQDGNEPRNYETFPVITRLDSRDAGFKQFIADVEANRKRVFTRNKITRDDNRDSALISAFTVYQYVPREGDDLLSLAARCNLPYSTLASLNRLNHPSMVTPGKALLLPSIPGIFVPEEPQSDLENLLASSRPFPTEDDAAGEIVNDFVMRINGTAFYFIPGGEFSATERAFFLNRGFRFPLRSYRLTSGFGMRKNPVTGNMRLHQGLDLAAPAGTEVYAAGDGVVTEIGNDSIYGNYIIIKHSGNWVSLYGHLQKVGTSLHSVVKSGMLIGWVGSTGQSTGPHLHFELQQNGKARDPDKYLFLPGRQ